MALFFGWLSLSFLISLWMSLQKTSCWCFLFVVAVILWLKLFQAHVFEMNTQKLLVIILFSDVPLCTCIDGFPATMNFCL